MLQRLRRLPFLVVAGLAVLSSAPAPAQDGFSLDDFKVDTGQNLLDICTLEEGHPSHWEAQAFCFGYFQGGADFHHALVSGPERSPMVCPPAGVTIRDAVAVFVDYARGHPERLAEPPMDVVFRAVTEEWPCQSG